jgi:hypothetical protein
MLRGVGRASVLALRRRVSRPQRVFGPDRAVVRHARSRTETGHRRVWGGSLSAQPGEGWIPSPSRAGTRRPLCGSGHLPCARSGFSGGTKRCTEAARWPPDRHGCRSRRSAITPKVRPQAFGSACDFNKDSASQSVAGNRERRGGPFVLRLTARAVAVMGANTLQMPDRRGRAPRRNRK